MQNIITESKSVIAWEGHDGAEWEQSITKGNEKTLGVKEILTVLIVVMFDKCVYISEFTKLYTLNKYGLLNVSYTSRKLLLKSKQKSLSLLKKSTCSWQKKVDEEDGKMGRYPQYIYF